MSAAPITLPRGQGERVLVVDDEEAVARLTTAALISLGYASVCFTSAEDMLREFEHEPESCQLIITDQTMPRVTGLDLARRIRGQGHAVPVLIITGFSRTLTPELVAELGQAAVLTKPFEMRELAVAVRRLLGGSRR